MILLCKKQSLFTENVMDIFAHSWDPRGHIVNRLKILQWIKAKPASLSDSSSSSFKCSFPQFVHKANTTQHSLCYLVCYWGSWPDNLWHNIFG